MRRLVLLALLSAPLLAQIPAANTKTITSDEALDRAWKQNVLTSPGPSFHALMKVEPVKESDPAFTASVEVFWQDEHHYRLVLDSPKFGQTLVVNGSEFMETDRGDFYPNWVRGFVTALLDPMPRRKDLMGRQSTVDLGPRANSCIRRDDKVNGITNDVTWSMVCFGGDTAQLQFAMDFTYNMDYSDFKEFGDKQIARNYTTGTKGHDRLRGTLSMLEEWKPDPNLLAVTKPGFPGDRIRTKLVSTLTEESMLESAPSQVAWPTVREGKLEGYMIVHDTTDRTGQVRETSKHNSDNPGLEDFGRELALKYKFKPLVVDSVAQQMEMPLVLHFTTTLGDPIPELDDKTSRSMISGCSVPREIQDHASAGQQIVIQFQVAEDGGLMTLGSSDRKIAIPVLYQQFRGCHFKPYSRNGVPTAYHANINVTAR